MDTCNLCQMLCKAELRSICSAPRTCARTPVLVEDSLRAFALFSSARSSAGKGSAAVRTYRQAIAGKQWVRDVLTILVVARGAPLSGPHRCYEPWPWRSITQVFTRSSRRVSNPDPMCFEPPRSLLPVVKQCCSRVYRSLYR